MKTTKSLRLSEHLAKQAEQEANKNGQDFSEYIRALIQADIASKTPYEKEVMKLYNDVSDLIQSLEIRRDYEAESFTLEMEELHKTLNDIWDQIRKAPQFHEPELPEE